MKSKLEKWESYTDEIGRRHWRWPPTERQVEGNPRAESGPRQRIGMPPSPQHAPMRPKDE